MKNARKIAALVMAAALTLSSLPMTMAADDAATPTISASSGEVTPGETVEVEISLSNNPGIVCLKLTCDYDSRFFKLVEVNDAGVLGSKSHKPLAEVANGGTYTLMWFNPTKKDNYTVDDVIATLTFEVASNAPAGDHEIDISYNYSKKEAINANLKAVYFEVEDSVVAVEDIGQGSIEDFENSNDDDNNNDYEDNEDTDYNEDEEEEEEDEDTPGEDLSDVKFVNKTYTYDGERKTLKVTGLPEDAEVEYEDNKATDVGTYRAYAIVTLDDETVELSAKLIIKPREITITGLTAEDKVYDGNTDAILSGGELDGVIDGDDVYVDMPEIGKFNSAAVGTNKTVTFTAPTLEGDDADNYTLKLPTLKADITSAGTTKPSTPEKPSDTETADPVITPKPWVNPFSDVTMNDWYYGAVKFASENGIMNGTSDAIFNPNGDITRSMFVTVLHRIAGTPAAAKGAFTDVRSGSWYEAAVNWASANGIVNGTSATTFDPNATITREQMATILYRYAKFKNYDLKVGQTRLFADSSDIADYAKDAMNWAADKGLITGSGDGTVTPKAYASRAQAATILQRMIEKLG